MRRAGRGLPRLTAVGGWALALGLLTAGLAPGAASGGGLQLPTRGRAQSPGGRTPADLGAEYSVLRSPAGPADHLATRWLRQLPASGIVAGGVRFLARATLRAPVSDPGAAPAVVPAGAGPLLAARQAGRRALAGGQLRGEYAHHALCLVIVYGRQESPTCAAAPGTVDPLLYAPGSPGFGMVPDGVPWVRVHYRGARPAACASAQPVDRQRCPVVPGPVRAGVVELERRSCCAPSRPATRQITT